jgi:hypothetical protein
MEEMQKMQWKINVEKFSEFNFVKDDIDLLIINYSIDKTYIHINDLYEYVLYCSGKKITINKVKNRFECLIGDLKFTTMWRGLNYPDETKVKGLYLIRQNEDSWKQKYLNNKIMTDSKVKSINEFGILIYDVLWTEKSKNKKVLKKLKNLITNKTKLDFTKEEFIQEFFFDNSLFPSKPIEDFNNVEMFEFTFFEDSYDAVTFQTSSYSTIILLEERIADFHLLVDSTYGVDNVAKYNK